MAVRGVGFFDGRGQFFKSPDEATISDLCSLLGRMGEHDSLAPGIAKILFERRREIEHIFADHDSMMQGAEPPVRKPVLVSDGATVTALPTNRSA